MIKPHDKEFIVHKARPALSWHALDHLSGAQEYRLLIGYRYEQPAAVCAARSWTVIRLVIRLFVVEECVFDRSRTSHLSIFLS